jgi:hypothetical protein
MGKKEWGQACPSLGTDWRRFPWREKIDGSFAILQKLSP